MMLFTEGSHMDYLGIRRRASIYLSLFTNTWHQLPMTAAEVIHRPLIYI